MQHKKTIKNGHVTIRNAKAHGKDGNKNSKLNWKLIWFILLKKLVYNNL